MKFQVDIPDEIFWKVAARAELTDQKVPDYAADLLIASAAARSPIESDPVLQMWRQGYTDAQIAGHLNLLKMTVANRRRRLGLPANRRLIGETA